MLQINISRKWFMAIIGFSDFRERAKHLTHFEYLELKEVLDNYLSRIYREFRKKGAIIGSLLWSEENLAPIFLLEATDQNRKFILEQRAIIDNLTENVYNSLTSDEERSNLGKNLKELNLEGKALFLECNLPFNPELYPENHQIISAFSDMLNSELRTIKRAELDFTGRKNWLATIEAIFARGFTKDVGPIKKLREIKSIMSKRKYESENPGDFEKIIRVLSDAIPFRSSLFDLEKPSLEVDGRDVLGHIVIQYLSTEGDFPIKLHNRSTTFDRLGRRAENNQWVLDNEIDWQKLDNLIFHSKEIVYDKIEKMILDVGGVKLDNLWSATDLSNNAYFLSQFSFTEDILKNLKNFISEPRQLLENQIGPGTTSLYELWIKVGLHFNIIVFEVRSFDSVEEKKLIEWIKLLKEKKIPGPSYTANADIMKQRHYRPF